MLEGRRATLSTVETCNVCVIRIAELDEGMAIFFKLKVTAGREQAQQLFYMN
jgi:hypothetical protein